MIRHYILMSSSYSLGQRIALHRLIKSIDDYEEYKTIFPAIQDKCGKDVSVSTHFLDTENDSWESVAEKDPFFKDVKVVDSLDEFTDLIMRDRVITGLDVARYILCKVKCTHLKLQKLLYFCYADYLCEYGEELFRDKIYAYRYGPIIKSVYDEFKQYGADAIAIEKEHEATEGAGIFSMPEKSTMPERSRIIFSQNGSMKIFSIDKTIEKYGGMRPKELVDLTHRKNTPWFFSGKGKCIDRIIEDDVIKQYHMNEVI